MRQDLGVQYAKKVFGAHVVAIDINDEKLAFAKESGEIGRAHV